MPKTNVEQALQLAPPWESGPIGQLWVSSIGFLFDLQAEYAVQALKGGMMRSDTFHSAGLPLVGRERRMPRYPAETDDEYLLRLRGAWEAWADAGNFNSIVDQLAVVGLTAEIWEQGQKGRAPLQDSAVIWDWDDDLDNWSRFFVVITGHPWTGDVWGDPPLLWGDEGTWGSNAPIEEVETARAIVTQWKAAHVVYPHIIIDLGTWTGKPPVTTGDRYDLVANRSTGALYWDVYGVRDY